MTSPSSPSVQVRTCTSSPAATWWAIVTPQVRASSSGWAWTKSNRVTAEASDDLALLGEVAGDAVTRHDLDGLRHLGGALVLRLGAPGAEDAAAGGVLR